MASKRTLSAGEQQRYRDLLQVAAIGALMDSRRWEPGELAFQGGTCLHLVHGSARFSEDLDFMVRGGLSLVGLSAQVQRRLQNLPGVPADLQVAVSDAKGERNPHAFMVTLGGPDVIGSAKVKIELWATAQAAMQALKVVVRPVTTATTNRAFVPTLELPEIVANKVYALGARDRLKPRDVFDLWWLGKEQELAVQPAALLLRLQIYPAGTPGDTAATAARWLSGATKRLALLHQPNTPALVSADLKRWLPTSWKMDPQEAQPMIDAAVLQLQRGVQIVEDHFPQEGGSVEAQPVPMSTPRT